MRALEKGLHGAKRSWAGCSGSSCTTERLLVFVPRRHQNAPCIMKSCVLGTPHKQTNDRGPKTGTEPPDLLVLGAWSTASQHRRLGTQREHCEEKRNDRLAADTLVVLSGPKHHGKRNPLLAPERRHQATGLCHITASSSRSRSTNHAVSRPITTDPERSFRCSCAGASIGGIGGEWRRSGDFR